MLEDSGMAARVTRRLLDIASSPEEVETADVVVLHRVVCCYPDYERLLSAAASHAKRLLVFSHPPRNLFTRSVLSCENLLHRLRSSDFRAFVHPPAAMINVAEAKGSQSVTVIADCPGTLSASSGQLPPSGEHHRGSTCEQSR